MGAAARAAILTAALMAALLPASPAGAQAPGQPEPQRTFFELLFSPSDFVNLIVREIAGNPAVTTWLLRIGVLLAAFLFLWNLYMALAQQSPGLVTDALIRAAIVGTIFANLPFVGKVLTDFHSALSAIGFAVFDAVGAGRAMDEALVRLEDAINTAAGAITGLGLFDAVKFIFIAIYAAAIMLLFLAFMVVAIAIYNFLLLGSYVTLAVAVLLTPLSLACLASRSTQNFVFEWLQVVLHSALVAMLTKVVAGIIVNVAVADRILAYANGIVAASGDFGQMMQAIVGLKELVPAIVMLAIGLFTLLNVQGIASAFVGRVESVAGALAGLYFAGRMVSRPVAAAAGALAPRGAWGFPTARATGAAIHSGWEAVRTAPGAAMSAARSATQRALAGLATYGGPVGYALAERLGFDRTLPDSPDIQEYLREASDRFYRGAEEDLRRLGWEPPPPGTFGPDYDRLFPPGEGSASARQTPLGLEGPEGIIEPSAPAGSRIEPTDDDVPSDQELDPYWEQRHL